MYAMKLWSGYQKMDEGALKPRPWVFFLKKYVLVVPGISSISLETQPDTLYWLPFFCVST